MLLPQNILFQGNFSNFTNVAQSNLGQKDVVQAYYRRHQNLLPSLSLSLSLSIYIYIYIYKHSFPSLPPPHSSPFCAWTTVWQTPKNGFPAPVKPQGRRCKPWLVKQGWQCVAAHRRHFGGLTKCSGPCYPLR